MNAETTHQTKVLHHLGDNTCKTIDAIATELGLKHRQISWIAKKLIDKGYLERVELGCFQLTVAGQQAVSDGVQITSGPNAPHSKAKEPSRNTLRQRAWNIIRIQRRFTIPDLQTTATIGDEKLAENNLQRYCNVLCKAGVLRRLPRRQKGTAHGSNGFAQFVLVRDLGAIAPVYRANAKSIFDHNSGEEFSL